uniref:Uncharacterized protein n=1 Tax=Arundo donax TaxID=35708 RepID=A0A0A8ZX79_ARUDO
MFGILISCYHGLTAFMQTTKCSPNTIVYSRMEHIFLVRCHVDQ